MASYTKENKPKNNENDHPNTDSNFHAGFGIYGLRWALRLVRLFLRK